MVDTTDPRALGEELERLSAAGATVVAWIDGYTSPAEKKNRDPELDAALRVLRNPGDDRHRFASPQTAGEVGEKSHRTLTDPQRMLWRDDVEGICPSPELCFESGAGRARCAPCAIKQAAASGVESDLSVPDLPDVYRLRREVASLTAERDAALVRCEEMRRTIEREREECAKVAKTYPKRNPFGPTTRAAVSAAIATAIRARAALGDGGGG